MCGRGAEVQGPGGVGGAVEVLRSGIAQVDGVGVDDGARAWFWLVVDYGGAVGCERETLTGRYSGATIQG